MSQYLAVVELSSLDGLNGFEINGEAASDYCGWSVSSARDVNGDGLTDLIVGAPDSKVHGIWSGSSYVVFGNASGFASTLELSSLDGNNGFRMDGEAGERSGWSVSSAGDVNGDGFADVIVGAYAAQPNGGLSGASYVVFGKAAGFGATLDLANLDGNNGFRIDGEATGDQLGWSVSSAGDVNGDGFDDFIEGARHADPIGSDSGSSYVVFGKGSGFGITLDLATLDGNNGFRLDGVLSDDNSGYSVASAGDLNGDGLADMIVGAPSADPHGNTSGSSYVVFGKAGGFSATFDLSSLDGTNGFPIYGEATNDASGFSVSSAGDVNGDGFDDVIVGAFYADPHGTGSGSSYVVFGKTGGFGTALNLSSLDGNNGFRMDGGATRDFSGCSVSSAGDVNGDGFADLIVGAKGVDPNGSSSGASYVVFGKAAGFGATFDFSSLDGNNGFKINGEADHDYSGRSVASAGDVNGDGFDDLVIGAYRADPHGVDSGSSYVIFGSMPDEAVSRIGTAIDNTIHGGNFRDTLSGLQGDDTLFGHGRKDTLSGGQGNDTLIGGLGRDTIQGGAAADLFVYVAVSESPGRIHDTIISPDFAADRFDLSVAVTGIDAEIVAGILRKAHFENDLGTAVDGAHLAAGHAVLFTPDDGNQSGRTFLIVDQNGTAGYQAGEDLVVQFTNAVNLASLDTGDFI